MYIYIYLYICIQIYIYTNIYIHIYILAVGYTGSKIRIFRMQFFQFFRTLYKNVKSGIDMIRYTDFREVYIYICIYIYMYNYIYIYISIYLYMGSFLFDGRGKLFVFFYQPLKDVCYIFLYILLIKIISKKGMISSLN